MVHRPPSRLLPSVRPAAYLLLGLALAACTTEVRSLTHVQASLEAGPGLAPLHISYLARGGFEQTDAAKLEVRFDGQPVVLDNGQPLEVNTTGFMLTYFVPQGPGAISFLRDGQTVAESDPLEFEVDRINHLFLYGDPDSPELLVLEDPYQQRRVRLVNVHEHGEPVTFALADQDGVPLMDAMTLAYGDWWSESVDENVAFVHVASAGAASQAPIDCDPTFRLVVYREDEATMDLPPSLGPLVAPSAPQSAEAEAALCYAPDCACDASE